MSTLIEKTLWAIESKCTIHLSKIQIKPVYKGTNPKTPNAPQWRLYLSFSGYTLLFNLIPFPFFNVVLPTFIIPAPHALLNYLLTDQPLASGTLKHDRIDHDKILLAFIHPAQSLTISSKVLLTPPAVEFDVKLSGGHALAVETMFGRDTHTASPIPENHSYNSLSTINSHIDSNTPPHLSGSHLRSRISRGGDHTNSNSTHFDANHLIPWLFSASLQADFQQDQIQVNIHKLNATHHTSKQNISSHLNASGNLLIARFDESQAPPNSLPHTHRIRTNSRLNTPATPPSIPSILLFPAFVKKQASFRNNPNQLLQYDYAFDIDAKIDAVTLSVGASHPMLTGGTIVATLLESIYAYGSLTARQGATLNPFEVNRKRNILRHLPAVDFTCGIGNAFIPEGSMSVSDDGITTYLPEMQGGRMNIRVLGGLDEPTEVVDSDLDTNEQEPEANSIVDGIKFLVDFGVSSFAVHLESNVDEFPELDILEGDKLISLVSGSFSSHLSCHLRPQNLPVQNKVDSIGPNIFNPLEAFELDFADSSASLKIKESWATCGHRRLIMPTETTFSLTVVESVVDMSFDGRTLCELCWDFQGSSPILQVSKQVGVSPALASHEDKKQVAVLISALRQGRILTEVSSVGGISFKQAKTSRDYREGLYDWKFFNALVSPDQDSPGRLVEVLDDRPTVGKLLQVITLINEEFGKILEYIMTEVWRAKDIFDEEGVQEPKHVIPRENLARLLSLFLCGDLTQVDDIVSIIRRVTLGEGLDVVKLKELLRKNIKVYEEWAPEFDRAVRWTAVMLGPMAAPGPYVESSVPPLSEVPEYASRFLGIPSAKELYETLNDNRTLPLDPSFSNLVSQIAPYMSFKQVKYVLLARPAHDWPPEDLRRIRYVYSIKRKVLDISESYGGLSFLPQSFLVSVFLGEATRASLRARRGTRKRLKHRGSSPSIPARAPITTKRSTLSTLRRRRLAAPSASHINGIDHTIDDEDYVLTPAERVASQTNLKALDRPPNMISTVNHRPFADEESTGYSINDPYDLGDSLLGPQDVAILLQAGLTSSMKGSTVVQLNQRMLLDLIASQPNSFAIGVLCELGSPGGQGSTRGLTSALMALLELDQKSFRHDHRLDMHTLLETFSGIKMPRREHYLAGGRWARQSYYEALTLASKSILEDAEPYLALKGHIQRVRHNTENDYIPVAKELELKNTKPTQDVGWSLDDPLEDQLDMKLMDAIKNAKDKIHLADEQGKTALCELKEKRLSTKESEAAKLATSSYMEAFRACAAVLDLDKLSFQTKWFKSFYTRNYDALMLKSVYDNIVEDVDNVRFWMDALLRGARRVDEREGTDAVSKHMYGTKTSPAESAEVTTALDTNSTKDETNQNIASSDTFSFAQAQNFHEQEIIDYIIDVLFYDEEEREMLRNDPLVRLLISNPPGNYNFTIISAMGVITEGRKGQELAAAFERLHKQRGVETIRADTGTARSFEFNADKIEEAVEINSEKLKRPFGFVGYSQGCANVLTAETLLLSGSPDRQKLLTSPNHGLVCRQLLFSAINGSVHGPASDAKVQRLIVMCEEAFKYQQGYFSRAFISMTLSVLNDLMDSAPFQKFMGGAQTFLPDGCRSFWREAQHLPYVPTTVVRGVLEEHTTPECLEFMSHMLTKQSGSALQDSQVHVFDAVGHPIYTKNRNGKILENCDMGGAIQRTHHWSPLDKEVEFIRTKKDVKMASFECAKDRHIFPWVDVNARFGVIKYSTENDDE